jgi:hypothetical protein
MRPLPIESPVSRSAFASSAFDEGRRARRRTSLFSARTRTGRNDGRHGPVPGGAPCTPPELAPELVRKLATRYDALAGRYLNAEHDNIHELLARIDEIRERDLNRDPAQAVTTVGSEGRPGATAMYAREEEDMIITTSTEPL